MVVTEPRKVRPSAAGEQQAVSVQGQVDHGSMISAVGEAKSAKTNHQPQAKSIISLLGLPQLATASSTALARARETSSPTFTWVTIDIYDIYLYIIGFLLVVVAVLSWALWCSCRPYAIRRTVATQSQTSYLKSHRYDPVCGYQGIVEVSEVHLHRD